jgi:serine/threonine protein kinase
VKAENLLIGRGGGAGAGRWKLCDFGSATTRAQVYDSASERALAEEDIQKHTTPAYRAPEVRRRGPPRARVSQRGSWLGSLLLGGAQAARLATSNTLPRG